MEVLRNVDRQESVFDADSLMRSVVMHMVDCSRLSGNGVLMALDICEFGRDQVSLDAFGGLRWYLELPELFERPVVFYGWPHRVKAAQNLAKLWSGEDSLEVCVLQELLALHEGNVDAFLVALPIESVEWSPWRGKRLTRQQGRRSLVRGHLSSLVHDVRNLTESIGQHDEQRGLVERTVKILCDLESFIHFLDDKEKEELDSVLPCRPGERWSEIVGPTDIAPAATALGRICESMQATAE